MSQFITEPKLLSKKEQKLKNIEIYNNNVHNFIQI